MKNLLQLTLVLLILVSCKESPESSGSATSNNVESLMREVTGKNANKDKEYARLMEELMAKTPLSNNQFLEAFPKKLGNLSLDKTPSNGTDNVGADTQVMVGNYGNGTIKMEIIDAVGNFAGQAIFLLKSYDLLSLESDDNTQYSKKERNGILTSGVYVTSVNESELKFLYDNRFYVSLEGKGMDVDELWDAMDIDNLSQFKVLNN
jgi:hypothetical protein